MLAQNDEGLKNLFKLVSASHIDYFYRVPRIPRSLLQRHRKGCLSARAATKGSFRSSDAKIDGRSRTDGEVL
nr:PHP domain-containing protein [Planococcus glaciei]